jgi:tubulin beta
MHDDYPGRIISTWSLFPSPKVSDVVVEPYNCLLSAPKLIDFAHEVFCIDNDALFEICANRLNLGGKTSYGHMNHIVSMAMSAVTSPFRFPGRHSGTLRRMAVNLVPFPHLHFLTCALSPLTSGGREYGRKTVPELAFEVLSRENLLATCDPQNGMYFAGSGHFRGRMNRKMIDDYINEARRRNGPDFAEWIPWNLRTSLCDSCTAGARMSAVFMGNTTAFAEVFKRMEGSFSRLYEKKAFVHWYLNEGMEATRFDEARSAVLDLIQEYEMYTAKVGDEGEDEDETEAGDKQADGGGNV